MGAKSRGNFAFKPNPEMCCPGCVFGTGEHAEWCGKREPDGLQALGDSMIEYVIEPDGWPCRLGDCRPGLFMFNGRLNVKTEYGDSESYCGDSGETFWGGTTRSLDRLGLIVQPVVLRNIEELI